MANWEDSIMNRVLRRVSNGFAGRLVLTLAEHEALYWGIPLPSDGDPAVVYDTPCTFRTKPIAGWRMD